MQLNFLYAIEIDCSAIEGYVYEIIKQPQHGTAELVPHTDFPVFPKNNPRAKCNVIGVSKKGPGRAGLKVDGVRHFKYAIRLPANRVLQSRIGYLLTRPVSILVANRLQKVKPPIPD